MYPGIEWLSSQERETQQTGPLRSSITPSKKQYGIDEPIDMTVEITSRQRERLRFTFISSLPNNDWIGYRLVGVDSGKVIASCDPIRQQGGLFSGHSTGPKAFQAKVILKCSVMPRKPGAYRIVAMVPVRIDGPDGKEMLQTLVQECRVDIVLSRRRTLIEQARAVREECQAGRVEREYAIDYLLACPEDVGFPILSSLLAETKDGRWGELVADKLLGYPYCEQAVRLLVNLLNRLLNEFVQQRAFSALYCMYAEGTPAARPRIEQIAGARLAERLRQQLQSGAETRPSYG